MDRILINPPRVLATASTAPVAPGARVHVYEGGTTTPVDLFTAEIVASAPQFYATANPAIADASGYVPDLFTDYAGPVRVVITTSEGVAISTTEFAARVSTLNSAAGTISYSPSAKIPDDNVQDALDTVSDFMVGWSDGTEAAPGRAFSADLDTGLYRPAANRIAFAFGGAYNIGMSGTALRIGQDSTDRPDTVAATTGVGITSAGIIGASAAGAPVVSLNRNSDGQIMQFRRGTTAVGSVSVTATDTAFNTSSDYRLKAEAATPVGWSAVDLVADIAATLRHFTWNATGELDYGAFAHELQVVFPKAVTGVKDGEEMQQVDWSKLVPVLLKSVADLAARVEQLEQAQ